MSDVALALAVIALLAVANAFATRVVLQDKFAERHQRIAQLLAVWLMPVLGAILVFALHRKPEEPSRQYRDNRDPLDGADVPAARVGRAIHPSADD